VEQSVAKSHGFRKRRSRSGESIDLNREKGTRTEKAKGGNENAVR